MGGWVDVKTWILVLSFKPKLNNFDDFRAEIVDKFDSRTVRDQISSLMKAFLVLDLKQNTWSVSGNINDKNMSENFMSLLISNTCTFPRTRIKYEYDTGSYR